MIVQKKSVNELIKNCKSHKNWSLPVDHYLPANMPDFPEVDHFILNEAEITLPQFLG